MRLTSGSLYLHNNIVFCSDIYIYESTDSFLSFNIVWRLSRKILGLMFDSNIRSNNFQVRDSSILSSSVGLDSLYNICPSSPIQGRTNIFFSTVPIEGRDSSRYIAMGGGHYWGVGNIIRSLSPCYMVIYY